MRNWFERDCDVCNKAIRPDVESMILNFTYESSDGEKKVAKVCFACVCEFVSHTSGIGDKICEYIRAWYEERKGEYT